jgi:hypothetical protein
LSHNVALWLWNHRVNLAVCHISLHDHFIAYILLNMKVIHQQLINNTLYKNIHWILKIHFLRTSNNKMYLIVSGEMLTCFEWLNCNLIFLSAGTYHFCLLTFNMFMYYKLGPNKLTCSQNYNNECSRLTLCVISFIITVAVS